VPDYSFTVTEHDAERPWIVVSHAGHTATLDEGMAFYEWALERWPGPRWKVELDPWQTGEPFVTSPVRSPRSRE
jgi:hypothetical protein